MRKLLTICVVLCSALGWAGTCGNGYSFSREIKLHRAVNSDQSSFPFTISGGAANASLNTAMKVTGSGGSVQNTTTNSIGHTVPADVVFCDASSAGNALKYEMDNYDGTTSGAWTAYVKIPTLHTASTDSIWVFIGNASVTTSQNDLTLWSDAGYQFVDHFPNGSSLTALDSTGTMTTTLVGSPTATGGIIDGAMGSVSSSNYLKITQNASLRPANVTVEAWGSPSSCNTYPALVSLPYATSGWSPPFVSWALSMYSTSCQSRFAITDSGTIYDMGGAGPTAPLNVWSHFAGTYDGTTIRAYFNGVQNNSMAHTGSITYPVNADATVGQRGSYSPGDQWTDKIDEVRISNTVKSADWLLNTWILNSGQINPPAQNGWKVSPFVVQETYSTPTIRQWIGCASDYFSRTCPMAVPLVSGNTIIMVMTTTDAATCTTLPTDTLGLTYTLQASDSYTGTLHSYQSCVVSAPITSSGMNTITLPNVGGPNSAAMIYEVTNVSTSGVVSTNAGNTAAPPAVMTATSPGANSFLICGTRNTDPGGPPPVVPTNSQGYSAYQSGFNSGDHPSSAYAAFGVVSSGSKSCTLSSGNGGVMAIFGFAPSVSKRRMAQVY